MLDYTQTERKIKIFCFIEINGLNEKMIFNLKAWRIADAFAYIIDKHFNTCINKEIFKDNLKEATNENVIKFFEAITNSKVILYAEDASNVITTVKEINVY